MADFKDFDSELADFKRGSVRRALLTCHCEKGEHAPFAGKEEHPALQYANWQAEIAPRTNKYHLQIYAEFKKNLTYKQIQELAGCKVHIRKARKDQASRERCRAYCMKEDTRAPGYEPKEIGTWREAAQGGRTDLEEILAKVKAGTGLKDIMEEYTGTWSRAHVAIEKMYRAYEPKRIARKVPMVVVWHGPPGSGKTTKLNAKIAEIEAKGSAVYEYSEDNGWWDNYTGQPVIAFNNFEDHSFDRTTWLRICDSGSFSIKRRYIGPRCLDNKLVLITSVKHPRDWWKGQGPQEEVTRRFEHGRIIECEVIPREQPQQEDKEEVPFD